MNRIIDLGILLLTVLAVTYFETSGMEYITVLLICLGITLLIEWFDDKKHKYILHIIYNIAVLFQPALYIGMPFMMYEALDIDCLRKAKEVTSNYQTPWWNNQAAVLVAAYFFNLILGIYLHLDTVRVYSLIISLVALALSYKTLENQYLRHKYFKEYDSKIEITNELTNKNKSLIDNLDSEIQVATLTERNRIAREIHDNVGHMLTRAILQMGALIVVNKDNKTEKEMLETVKATLDEAMTSIRRSVHDLHDESINLEATINELINNISSKYNVNVEYDYSSELSKDIKLCIIGVIKESLSNIVKHSNADKVSIVLREHPAFYQLVVQDNGKCSGDVKGTGMGLETMVERAELVGGTLTYTASNKGFRVFMSIKR